MINFDKILAKFEMLDQFLEILREILKTDQEKFLGIPF
jgi:hypothetical protein